MNLPIAGVGHDVHVEAPDQLADGIETFVRDTPESDERVGKELDR